MGSIIASHYLERYPDDTDQPVVWLSPIFRNSHNQRNSHALYRILQIGTSPLPPPVRKKLFAARWVSRTVSHYLTHDKAQQEAIDQIHYQHSNCFDTARSLLADTKISMRQQTIIVKKRTTYMIFGANDKLTDSALTKQIANKHQIPHHEISYTGHLLNYETPEDVAKIIKKFLKTNPQ